MYEVTGNFSLVSSAKLLLYSLSMCYWWMENNFPEVSKASNTFLYVLCTKISAQVTEILQLYLLHRKYNY